MTRLLSFCIFPTIIGPDKCKMVTAITTSELCFCRLCKLQGKNCKSFLDSLYLTTWNLVLKHHHRFQQNTSHRQATPQEMNNWNLHKEQKRDKDVVSCVHFLVKQIFFCISELLILNITNWKSLKKECWDKNSFSFHQVDLFDRTVTNNKNRNMKKGELRPWTQGIQIFWGRKKTRKRNMHR